MKMNRHPDPHKAMGQALKEARETFVSRDIPSRDDRFSLVPEDDDAAIRLVLLAAGCGAAIAAIVISVFELVVL
jgi:hypothetical protein